MFTSFNNDMHITVLIVLIIAAERQQVRKFFAESELKEHPVVLIVTLRKKCFIISKIYPTV